MFAKKRFSKVPDIHFTAKKLILGCSQFLRRKKCICNFGSACKCKTQMHFCIPERLFGYQKPCMKCSYVGFQVYKNYYLLVNLNKSEKKNELYFFTTRFIGFPNSLFESSVNFICILFDLS